jgi:outer membrane protein OmpA-like peptidoglycan-associated protein
VRDASAWQALHLKNAAVSLVLLVPILLMLLALGATVQQPPPPEDPVLLGEEPNGGGGELPEAPPHDQPPIIVLTEAEGYSFETGKADITAEFSDALTTKIIPNLKAFAKQYNCDVIEVIGHTDGQPVAAKSNLDAHLNRALNGETVPLIPGSNADLGLMRAWSVIRLLREIGEFQGKGFYGYSAGQAILQDGRYAAPYEVAPNASRRRIEIRLRRSPPRPS